MNSRAPQPHSCGLFLFLRFNVCVGGVFQEGLNRYANWYFRLYVRVHLLSREFSTHGKVGWLPTH